MEKQQLIEVGQRLRKRRQELGYYGQLEVGTSQMSIDTLIKLSRSMHLTMEYIIFGTGEEYGDASAVIDLLQHCTPRELSLAEEVLKLFLMKDTPR